MQNTARIEDGRRVIYRSEYADGFIVIAFAALAIILTALMRPIKYYLGAPRWRHRSKVSRFVGTGCQRFRKFFPLLS